jgi:ankyrin repeat protein
MWAARKGHPEVAQLLLDAGAIIEEKDTKVRPLKKRYIL